MASGISTPSFAISQMALAGDADITSDFLVPPDANNVDGNFFTFSGLRNLAGNPTNFTVTKASVAEFSALNGQSVSYAILQFPASSTNPPHTHPRSAEFLYLVAGTLQVGFVDTTNQLFTQSLQAGDIFVFPKGLVHFQYNADASNPASAYSAFGSANAGTLPLPKPFSSQTLMTISWPNPSKLMLLRFKLSRLVLHREDDSYTCSQMLAIIFTILC